MKTDKPMYQIEINQADGPDDFRWDLYHETDNYRDACECAMFCEVEGHTARLFDPFVGKYYNPDGSEYR